MASRRVPDDRGQVILLTGILVVLAFILFSTQLSLLASLGQQSGRETENPLLDDYLLLRRTLEGQWAQELRNQTGVTVCPDMTILGQRALAQIELVETLQNGRANGFSWTNFTLTRASATTLWLNVTVTLYDPSTSIGDQLAYLYTCTSGTILNPASCSPSPAVCTIRLR